ncbi:MAG: transglycosylase SLT domain-containing protein [Gammaproteobacteria bacterium]|nr:transglycosylase SLT domain-containing protein [Gammaproteobacteria bacterium]
MSRRLRRYAAILLLPLLYLPVGLPAQASSDPELRRLLKEAIESDSGFIDRFEAQVWLLDMSRRLEKFVQNPKARIQMLKQVHYEAKRVDIEPELVLAVIEVESRFDEFAISVAGARGLMQVMPFWLNEIGISDNNLFKIRTNLRMGCTILRYYIDMEPDSLVRALARYNGSLGKTVYPNKVISALQRNWFKQ